MRSGWCCTARVTGRPAAALRTVGLVVALAASLAALGREGQHAERRDAPVRGSAAHRSPAPAGFGGVRAVGGRDRIFALAAWQGGALAVGARGLVMTHGAGAAEWERLALPDEGRPGAGDNLFAAAQTAGRLWLGGDGGTLWSSADLKRWRESRLPADGAVFVLMPRPGGGLLAAGEFGLLAEGDGSGSWRPVTLDWKALLAAAWAEFGEAVPHFYGGCRSRDAAFLTGEFGLLLRRDATGWRKVHGGGIEPALFGCAVGEDGRELVAVGQRGLIIRSDDGGQSWQTVREARGADLYRIIRVPGGWVAAGDERRFRVSPDGRQWRCLRADPVPIGWYADLLPGSDGRLIAAGGPGVLTEVAAPALLAGKGVACD